MLLCCQWEKDLDPYSSVYAVLDAQVSTSGITELSKSHIGHFDEPLYSRAPCRIILQYNCRLEMLISNKYLACQTPSQSLVLENSTGNKQY